MLNIKKAFLYPKAGFTGMLLNKILNHQHFIYLKETLNKPFGHIKLQSEITDVVYLNWLVHKSEVAHLIPKHFELESFNGMVMLTILNYKHGHFRPSIFNKMKSWFGSPNQSNWRLYLNDEASIKQKPTVLFIANVISSRLYSIGSRVFSNMMQTHYPQSFIHQSKNNAYTTTIQTGLSNSPSLNVTASLANEWTIPENFNEISLDYKMLLKKICEQDFAISFLNENKYASAEINLNFNYEAIKPLKFDYLESKELANITTDSPCFCFVIPNLTLTTLNEELIVK